MPAITALQARVDYDDSAVSQGVPRTQGHLQRFASAVGGIGQLAGVAFAGVGLAAAGMATGVVSAISGAANFQQSMADVSALLGGTDQEMKLLSDTALQLGMDVTLSGIGARDAAAAMQELAASGFNAGEIAGGAAKGVLLLASATGTDIPTAAQIAGDAFNQFRTSMGLTADFMPVLADLFAGAANASSISLTDIGESMKYIGPVAAGMGISIQDVTATIAALGNQGIKGSSAGTALRSMLVSLVDPSKEAAQQIQELGLQFFDSQGKIKDFSGISEELKTKLAGLTDQQRASALATMFGKEALSAATVLYGEGAEGIKKYLAEITKTGIAADTGAQRNNTLKGSLASLQGAFETAQIALGQAFLPALKGVADWAAKAVSAAIPLIQQYGPVLVGWLQQGMGVLMQWGGAIGGAVAAVVGAFQSFRSGQTTLAQFIGGMEIFAQTILGKLGGLASQIWPHMQSLFTTISGAITTYGPQIVAQLGIWARAFGDWALQAIPPLLANLARWYWTIESWYLGTALPAVIGVLAQFARAFGDWVVTTAVPYLQANVPVWLAALGDWLTGTAFPAVVAFITPLAEAFGTWVTETAIPFLLANVPQWIGALVGWWYGTAIPTALAFLVEMGQAFGTWVSETAVPYLQQHIPLWLVALGTYIRGTAMPAILTGLTAVGKQFGDWVTQTAVPYLQTNIPKWLTALTDWLTGTALPAIGTKATELGQALVNKFMDEAGKILAKVQTKMGEVPGAIKDGLGDLGSLLVNAGASLIGGLISGITSKIQDLKNVLGGITNSLPDWKGPANKDANLLFGAGQLVISGFIAGMAERIAAVQGMAETVTNAVTRAFGTEATTATATYREHIDDAAVAVNVFREQLTHLLAIMKTIPDRLSTEILTPGLTDALQLVQDYAAALRAIPTSISTSISTTSGGGGGGSSESAAAPNLAWTPGSSNRNTVNVTVTGNTLLGNSPETAADLARILTPELARVVQAGY